MGNAILYVRVSTDEQADKGFSQRDQDERLHQYCERNNLVVGRVIYEDYSAKTFERPAWGRLLVELRKNKGKGFDTILFTKWDRFSRNTADAYGMIKILMDFGIKPLAIEQPLDFAIPESKIMLAVYLSMPEVENDRRALNVKYGMRRGKKEGRWMGRALPGYKNKTREDGTKCIEPIEPEASLFRWAFETIAQNVYATEAIWAMAKRKGLKCAKNSFWDAIRNPCYCGKIIVPAFNDEPMRLVDGVHEPLIDEKLFVEVQDVLSGRKRDLSIKKVIPESLPLRGFLLCPSCNRTLTGSASKGRNGYFYYYHCKSPCKVRLPAETVNEWMNKELKKFIPKPGVAELYREIVIDEISYHGNSSVARRKDLMVKITQQNERVSKLRELLLSEKIDGSDYKEMKTQCDENIRRLESDLLEISIVNKQIANIHTIVDQVVSSLLQLEILYREATITDKQLIIGSIFQKKIVFSENEGRTAELNQAAEIIYLINSSLDSKKAGVKANFRDYSGMVPRAGVEPARPCGHRCLRPARLPIPPSGPVHNFLSEAGCKCIQTLLNSQQIFLSKINICNVV